MLSENAANEGRFKLVVEYSPIAMLLVNVAGTIEMVNVAAESLFGYTRTELVGQPIDILVPEALLVHHQSHRADFAAAPQPRAMDVGRELHALHKNGSQFPVEISLNPIETQDGIVVLASITDLSARRRTEQMWRHYASVIESSEDAIISKTMDGIITSWNPAAERIFGYPESEAIGKPITMLFPPDRLAEEAGLIERLARGERIARYDTLRVRKDGSPVEVSITLSPIKYGFEKIVRARSPTTSPTANGQKRSFESALRSCWPFPTALQRQWPCLTERCATWWHPGSGLTNAALRTATSSA